MPWLWLLVPVALVVVVVLVGRALPARSEGETSRRFAASPQAVWDALHDVAKHPMGGKMARSVTELETRDGRLSWTEDLGHGELISVRTVETSEPHALVREMDASSVPMSSRWEYALTPDGDGCVVSLRGVTDIRDGDWKVPIFRVMMRVGGGVKKGLDIQLGMVANTLGESA